MRVVVGAVALVVVVVAVVVGGACEPRTINPDNPKAICRFAVASDAWTVLDMPRAVSLVADARTRGVIVAGTVDGVFTSTDCAGSFVANAGPRGIVNAVASGANASSFIASAGGVWATNVVANDAAPSWTRVTSSPPVIDARSIAITEDAIRVASVGAVAVVGTFNGQDGWSIEALGDVSDVPACVAASFDATKSYGCAANERRATFAPSSSDVVYVVRAADVTGGQDSIARSNDSGATFADVDVHPGPGSNEAHTVITGLAVDGADDAFLYATTASPPAIWTSDDGGATWTQSRTIGDNTGSVAGSPVATSDVAGFAVVRTSNALLRTDDHAATWDDAPAAGSPGAGIVAVAPDHSIGFTTATGVIVDDESVDVGSRITALAPVAPGGFLAATQRGVVLIGPAVLTSEGETSPLGDGPGGFFVDVAQAPLDGVLRIALFGDMQAQIGDTADNDGFASIFINDGALELTPGGDLAATSEGVIAANGESGACFLAHGDDSEGHALDLGANAFDAVAASPDSPTVWLVSSTTHAAAASIDGGASIAATTTLPPELAPPVALDGSSLAILSTRSADGAANGAPVVVDVDNTGAIAARTPRLPCTPSVLIVARGLDDLAYVVAGGDCADALIVAGIP